MPSQSKHLIIGLGGSGLTMVRALRCILSEELLSDSVFGPFYKPDDKEHPYQINGNDLKISYLEVDSSTADLVDPFDGCYPVSGPSLLLGQANQLDISSGGKKGAEQKRPTGASYFLSKAPFFEQKVGELVKSIGGAQGCSIHICAGLAGGTGSGSIVDAVCRIRKMYPHNSQNASPVKIHLYLYLPIAGFGVGAQKQYAPNGYAALAELSSLNTRQWTPIDKTPGNYKPYVFSLSEDEHQVLPPVFSSCYLFNKNDNAKSGGCCSPMRDQMGQLFGYFLYEKLFVWPHAEAGAATLINNLKRADANENLADSAFEYSYDMDKDAIKKLAIVNGKFSEPYELRLKQEYAIHANNFQTVGLKRLVVPMLEIKNHYAAVLANEGLLQMRYNLSTPNNGYQDPEARLDTPEKKQAYQNDLHKKESEIKLGISGKKLTIWNLNDDGVISCQAEMLANDPVEKISVNWTRYIGGRYQLLCNNNDRKKHWCDDLKDAADKYYEAGYHRIPGQTTAEGVDEYYKSQESQIGDRVNAHIDKWVREQFIKRLFTEADTADERCSLLDMHLTVKALHGVITDKNGSIDKIESNIAQLEKKIPLLNAEAEKQRKNFNELGLISGLIHRETCFQQYRDALSKLCIAKTQKQAYLYAREYLSQLAEKTAELKESTEAILNSFDQTLRGVFKPGTTTLEKEGIQTIIRNNCPLGHDLDASLASDICVKVYDPKTIEKNDKELRGNPKYAKTYLSVIRRAIRETLLEGDKELDSISLTDLHNYFQSTGFRQILMDSCRELIDSSQDFAFTRVFNINKEIQNNFKGRAQQTLGDTINAKSQCPLELSGPETTAQPESNEKLTDNHEQTKVAFIPSKEALLVKDLHDRLEHHLQKENIASLGSETEILVTRIDNAYPPRAFTRVHELYGAYRQLREDPNATGVFTDPGNEPFEQFFPSREEIVTLYRGMPKEYVSEFGDITDTVPHHGSLLKRYLLGHVRCKEAGSERIMSWCTLTSDTPFTAKEEDKKWRVLMPKKNDCFLVEDYLESVLNSITKALTPQNKSDYDRFTLLHLYREMKQTEKAWQEIVNPSYLSDKILEMRGECLARLDALADAVKSRYNDMSREYVHIVTLQKYYGEQLGRK